MLLPGDPGGVNRYKQHIWTAANMCDLGQQGDLYKKIYYWNTEALKMSNYNIYSRYLPSLLICAIWAV